MLRRVEQQMPKRATPRVGYWAAYCIIRDGGWGVASDALGRIIRCETENLALSAARYRPSPPPPILRVTAFRRQKRTFIAGH